MTRQQVMRGHQVVIISMRQRPHHGVFIRAGGQLRQVLANQKSRHFAGHGPKLAPNLRRGIGLHVKSIQLAGRAGEKDDDDRFWLLRRSFGRPCPGPQDGR